MNEPATAEEPPDFSLVPGGLLFRLYRRTGLCGEALEFVRRRMLVMSGLTWVPLLVLSAFAGHALGSDIKIPFLHDIEAHVRFLIALPVLIAAELIVHSRIRNVVRQFVERRVVSTEELPKFSGIVESTMRVRNSMVLEVALLVLVYTVGLWVWKNQIAHGGATWYANPDGTRMNLTPAGWWYVFVSIPFFQFILLRWYLRFLLWFSFLWRVSRLNLQLIPIHPDRAGGIGFLGRSIYAFGPILFAQGALLAGLIASRIFHEGQNLMDFKMEVAGFVGFFIVAVVCPLLVFLPHLARAKREGTGDFSRLSSRYTRKFEEKWIHGGTAADEELLGSADIQSLADLGNSYSVVKEMRLVPFALKDLIVLAIIAAIPLLPLGLTIFSLEELVGRLFKAIF